MKPFHIMAKPHGPICNLDCTYCYYLEKENLYGKSGRDYRMRDEVLEAYIRQYIQAQPGEHVSFAWQGGEPTLLGIPFFERVLEFQNKYANGRTVDNAFQTNGTLLDDAWASSWRATDSLLAYRSMVRRRSTMSIASIRVVNQRLRASCAGSMS